MNNTHFYMVGCQIQYFYASHDMTKTRKYCLKEQMNHSPGCLEFNMIQTESLGIHVETTQGRLDVLFESYFRPSPHTTVEYNYIGSILCFAFSALGTESEALWTTPTLPMSCTPSHWNFRKYKCLGILSVEPGYMYFLKLSYVILGYLQSDVKTMLLDHSTEINLQLAEDWKPSSTSQLLTKQNSSPGTSDKQ